MKHKLTKIAVAVSLAIGASQANAAIATGNSAELFLAAWSPSLQVSYVRDLGISITNFLTTSTTVATSGSYAFNPAAAIPTSPGSVVANSYSLNFQTDSLMMNALGVASPTGTTLASDVVWMVGALDQLGSTPGSRRTLSTVGNSDPQAAVANQLNAGVQNMASVLGYITDNNVRGTHTSLNGSSTATPLDSAGTSAYFPTLQMQSWGNNASFQSVGNVGESLPFFFLTTSTTTGSDLATNIQYRSATGTDFAWTLNVDGSLSYAAVPIPAAAWLFGSGLLGLIGIARRRKTLAA